MIVHLDQNEIHTALIEYISNQGYPVSGKKVEVTLIAGRGEKGHSAQLSFETISTQTSTSDSAEIDPDDNQQAIKFQFANTED